MRHISGPLALLQRRGLQKQSQPLQQLQQLKQTLRMQQPLTHASGVQRFVTTVHQPMSQIPSTQITPHQQSQDQLQAKLLQGLRQTPSPGAQQLSIQGKPVPRPASLPTPTQALPIVTQEGYQQGTQSLVRTLNQPHPQQQLVRQPQQVLVRLQQPHRPQYQQHLTQTPQRMQQPVQQQSLQIPQTSAGTPPAANLLQGEGELIRSRKTEKVTPESRPAPSSTPTSTQPQVQSPGQPKPSPTLQDQGQGQPRQPYSMRPRHQSRPS